MARETLELLFGDSYKDIKCNDAILTVKTIEQLEREDRLYRN